MQLLKLTKALPLFVLPLLLGACASEAPAPVAAAPERIISDDQMLRDSQITAQLGNRWKSGKMLVERGNNMVRDGQTKIDEGNHMIEEGNKIMQESEESYKTIKN